MNVLIVTTSCNMLAPDHPTGLWLEEFAVPFTAFSEAGASIRVVSPKGGAVPIDPKTAPTEKDREKWPAASSAQLHRAAGRGRGRRVRRGFYTGRPWPDGGPGQRPATPAAARGIRPRRQDGRGRMPRAGCAAERAECGGRASGQRAEGHRLHQRRGALGLAAQRGALLARRRLEGTRCELRIRSPAVFLPRRARREPDHWPNPASSTKVAEELLAALEEGSRLTS